MAELIPGRASPEGTAAYARRLADRAAPGHYRAWRGWSLSSLGLGSYLGGDDPETDALYREAVRSAVEAGLNVLDCAINYRSQRSERAFGDALRRMIAEGRARREELVVATKGGFLPFDGARPPNPRAYIEETYVRPGIFTWEEFAAGCHCMTPGYLRDQLWRSRANLGLATIDIYYLHNPETQLAEVGRDEFRRRVAAAFEALEGASADGQIAVYGTATWSGFRQPADAADHLSLAEMLATAREVGGADHRFRVLQLPYNLAMPEAFAVESQRVDGRGSSVLEAAEAHGLYVMVSASILQGRLARGLPAQLRALLAGFDTDAQRALQFVRSTPGVGTALVGMKQPAHLEENCAVARVPPMSADTLRALFQ